MSTIQTRIAEAARDLYVEEGAAGFSMRKVAGRVGVTATALYRHYDGKQRLLDEITEAGFSIFEVHLKRALKGDAPRERILGIGEALLRFSLLHPRYFELLFISARPNVRRFPDDFARRRSKTFQILADEVEAGMRVGALRKHDPMITALGIWAVGHGLICLWRSGRFGSDKTRFRKLYRSVVEQHLDGLAA